jgi:lysophospholipase L1-like esterase
MHDSILLLGSSIIKKWNNPLHLLKMIIINKGISRLVTRNLLSKKYLSKLYLRKHPKYIVIYIGGNDMQYTNDKLDIDNVYLDKSLNNISVFINILQKMFNNSKIIFISVIKSPYMYENNKIKNINYFNKKLSKICKLEKNVIYVNVNRYLDNKMIFYDDKIHLNEHGYAIMDKCISSKINYLF